MKHIPNLLTSLNLTSGFVSIIFILTGDINTASWLILAGMVFDFSDGFAARALKAYSQIGKELDSLADMVSFGVAPGLIIWHLFKASMGTDAEASLALFGISNLIIIAISAIMPVCAALRLAKFNIDTTQTTSFKGLPTPANALAVISIALGGYYSGSEWLISFMASPVAIGIFSLTLSALMVTRIPLLALKFTSLRIKGNEGRYLLIITCVVLISVFGIGGIPWIIPAYIVVSLISLLF